MNKKTVMGIFIILLVLCGLYIVKSQNQDSKQITTASITQQTDTKAKGKKALIAYFSYTGHTRALAKQIQELTGADSFELQPVTPYSDDYKTVEQQGKKEVEEDYRPKLKEQIPNLKNYDVIFVGTPIWWYSTSPVVMSFLSSPELAGKTIIPFCTHGGYGAGHSLDNMKKAAPNAKILDELVIEGRDDGYDLSEIKAWLKKVNFN